MEEHIPVLVAGGGTVGLSAALFLAHHGVTAVAVERHAGISIHPRALGIGPRTVELFREAGIEEEFHAAAARLSTNRGRIVVRTLAGDLPTLPRRAELPMAEDVARLSPVRGGPCSQDVLDEVLLSAALRRGADVRFGTEVLDVAQDPDGVDVTLVDRDDGRRRRVRADHLVVADGAGGRVKELLGIPASGPGPLGPPLVNILFRADLRELVDGREFLLCEVANDEVQGLLLAIGGDRWVLHIPTEEVAADRCVELVRAAVGLPDLAVEILSVLSWRAAARVADRFREGRAFLVGDAAHVVPPAGAFGLNTGIADAHNLAWKLAMVGRGQAGASLLDTYDPERRPVARFTMDQALLRVRFPELHWNPSLVAERIRHGVANPVVVGLGYRYASSAVIGGRPVPSLEDVALDGTPGSRVPHAWLERDGARLSTLDLAGTSWALLAGPDGQAWCEAAAELGEDLVACRIAGDWCETAGVGPAGALLVRPDRFVAWRATTSAPAEAAERLRAVLDEVLSRGDRRPPASARAEGPAAPA